MKEILFSHSSFGIAVGLLLFCFGLFVYLAIKMDRERNDNTKSKSYKNSAEKYFIGFTIVSVLLILLLAFMTFRHYHILKFM